MKTTPTDTPTPRTDAFCAPNRGLVTGYYQALEFSRLLERELTSALSAKREAEEVLDRYNVPRKDMPLSQGWTLAERVEYLCSENAELSREVEKERSNHKALRDHYDLLKKETGCPDDEVMVVHHRELQEQLNYALAQVEAMRGALLAFQVALGDGPENCSYAKYEEVNEQAEQALANAPEVARDW